MAAYMDQFLWAIQRPSKKKIMKSNLFWKNVIPTAPINLMCRFENGWVSPRAARWLHKISLLLVFVGQQVKNRALDKKDWPVRSELILDSLNVLAPPLVERSKIVLLLFT